MNYNQFELQSDDGGKRTISISGVDVLKEVVIAISKPKFSSLFGVGFIKKQEREKASGYKIQVVDISQKPINLPTAENATAYLHNCDPILPEDEKEDS